MELDSIQKTARGNDEHGDKMWGVEGKELVLPHEEGNTKDNIKGGKRGKKVIN